jgi:hypothetical protein
MIFGASWLFLWIPELILDPREPRGGSALENVVVSGAILLRAN